MSPWKSPAVSLMSALTIAVTLSSMGCASQPTASRRQPTNATHQETVRQETVRHQAIAADESAVDSNLRQLDAQREAVVERRLDGHPTIRTNQIDALVRGDVVTLQGSVPTVRARKDAEVLSDSTYGLITVDNQLEIDPPAIESPAEASITKAVRRGLESENKRFAALEVRTTQGWVDITGTLDNWEQYDRALTTALHITDQVRFEVDVRERKRPSSMPDADDVFHPQKD